MQLRPSLRWSSWTVGERALLEPHVCPLILSVLCCRGVTCSPNVIAWVDGSGLGTGIQRSLAAREHPRERPCVDEPVSPDL